MSARFARLLLPTLLCLPLVALATTVHRCEAPDGNVTFTTMSCASDEQLSRQEIHPYLPGSIIAIIPPANVTDTTRIKPTRRDPAVVGQSEDKCGNLISARQRREAILNQRIIAGMSQQDVESALGKPNKVNIRNSVTTYRYDLKRGRSAQVDFDEKGCVAGKAKSRTAKSPR
ncbi:cell envelope protein SmpA [Pseudomonas syringae]|nr:cell envelope protein SmpA [Pseudomonas syringae]MCF5068255.1 cell envelope protein SmpA [Pseudomonas syringae]